MSQVASCVRFFTFRMARTALLVCCAVASSPIAAQLSFDQPPIAYFHTTPNDRISDLQKKIDSGEVRLEYSAKRGYLESVLKHLEIPESSQTLVFSKTSFQLRRISPHTPRALYFNDDVYIGWVKHGDVMEISATDPKLGTNFYTLAQKKSDRPKFQRHTHECLQCHASTLSRGVPGHLVRSVHPRPDGHPILSARTFLTDQTSPFHERWGGWYVTGQHGSQRHMGNLLVGGSDSPETIDMDKGANVQSLDGFCDTTSYLSGHSDIVALMVLEHQTSMHNLLARANFVTRIAVRDQQVINEMLERDADYRSEATDRRIDSAVEPLVQHLLFANEIELTDSISGSSEFTTEFAASGTRDEQGRSLREFDLKRRLFKFPCSYLIYSSAFDELPVLVKDRIYRRMWDVLTEKDTTEVFSRISSADRKAVLEILRETKLDLPAYWRET